MKTKWVFPLLSLNELKITLFPSTFCANLCAKFSHSSNISLLIMLSSLLGLDCINAGTSLALSLRSGDVVNLVLQTLRSLPGLPGMGTFGTEKGFDLLDRLAAGLGVGEPELERAEDAEASEEQEKAVFDVAEGRRNEETDSGVKLFDVSMMKKVKGCLDDVPPSYRWPRYPYPWHESQGTKPRQHKSSRWAQV